MRLENPGDGLRVQMKSGVRLENQGDEVRVQMWELKSLEVPEEKQEWLYKKKEAGRVDVLPVLETAQTLYI